MCRSLKAAGDLTARKVEARDRGPNVHYKGAHDGRDRRRIADQRPAGGYLWSDKKHRRAARRPTRFLAGGEHVSSMERMAHSRTTYDVEHEPLWGWKVSAYLLTKSIWPRERS